MEDLWRTAVTDSFSKFLGKIVTFLPNLLAMITIILVGCLIAWIVRVLLARFLKAIHFDKIAAGWGLTGAFSRGETTYSPSSLLSRFFCWLIVLVSLILGINALELAVTQALITQFFNYLPHLFAAILILVIGYWVAAFLSQAALIAAVNAEIEFAKRISQIVRWLIFILSLTMALYRLGVADKIIFAAFSITFGGVVLAAAIAFGWGGRELARDFLEGLSKKKKTRDPDRDRLSHL